MRVPIGVSKSPAGFVLLLFLLGCSDVTNADPDAGDGEPPGPMPDGAAAAPDPDPIDAAVRDEPAPMLDGVDDCANAPPIEGDYPAPGCRYDIAIPNLVVDVRPSCGAASDPPAGLRLTFPHRDPSRHMAVAWTTEAPTRVSEVRLGTDPDALDQVFRGHSFTYQTLDPRRVHEVHLCGLTPATTYYYQAGGEGGWSDVGSFATAPEDEAEPFTFAVLGDTRSIDFVMWHDALEQIATMGVDFLLFAGDAVVFGLAQEQWDDWFAAGQPYLASLPIIPANGNHDFIGVHWLAQFALPRNEENYSYRYGNTAIVAMTDTFVHEGGVIEGRARTFLDATLTDNALERMREAVHHFQEPDDLGSGSPRSPGLDGISKGLEQRHAPASGETLHAIERRLADSARRFVHDSSQCLVVLRIHEQTQIGHHVLDLCPVIEALPSNDGVGHIVFQELFFEDPGLCVGPIQNCDASEGNTLTTIRDQKVSNDELRFVPIVLGFVEADRGPTLAVRVETLLLSVSIVGDDRGGARENRLSRSIVLLELDHLRVGIILLEIQDVPNIGAAPRVDRLIGITHDAEIPMAGSKLADDSVLNAVGVLILVDEDVAIFVLIVLEDARVIAEKLRRQEQEIAEVEGLRIRQFPLIARIEPGYELLIEILRLIGCRRRQ